VTSATRPSSARRPRSSPAARRRIAAQRPIAAAGAILARLMRPLLRSSSRGNGSADIPRQDGRDVSEPGQ
jgi:hypothetical protein